MTITLLTPPALEPVSLADAKAHMRVDHADEDAQITAMITSARQRVEALLGRALITRRVRETRDDWPLGPGLTRDSKAAVLALGPVTALHHVKVYDADGAAGFTGGASDYAVDMASVPGRIAPMTTGFPCPGRAVGGVEIEYDAGHGAAASDVPGPLRQAILLLVADAYAHRDAAERAEASVETPLPAAVAGLFAPYQQVRL